MYRRDIETRARSGLRQARGRSRRRTPCPLTVRSRSWRARSYASSSRVKAVNFGHAPRRRGRQLPLRDPRGCVRLQARHV